MHPIAIVGKQRATEHEIVKHIGAGTESIPQFRMAVRDVVPVQTVEILTPIPVALNKRIPG